MAGAAQPVLGGVVSMIIGGFVLSSTILSMNRKVERPTEVYRTIAAAPKVEKKKKKLVEQRVERVKPKPRRAAAAAPRPNIGADLAGLAVGLPMFQLDDMNGLQDDLLGGHASAKDMVLNEDAVDAVPVFDPNNRQPEYPARARAKGIEGHLVLKLVIGADGAVRKVKVVEAEPEGVFEDAVLEAARSWSFKPATYKGVAVQTTLTVPVAMRLN